MTDTLKTLQTLTTRAKKKDSAISVRVKQGTFDVCRVTYPNGAASKVESLTVFCTLDEAVEYLEWAAQ